MNQPVHPRHPYASLMIPVGPPKVPQATGFEYLRLANDVMKHKRAAWAEMNLRQDFPDEAWMRGHLRQAGISIKYDAEPASVERLRSLLSVKARVHAAEARAAVGKPLGEFLGMNPMLPLWAAVALVLEATGRFTPPRD